MNFNDLTDAQIELIKTVYADKSTPWEQRAYDLGKQFGVSERTVRRWAAERLDLKEKDDIEPEQYIIAKSRKTKKKKYYLVTWAQNNTPVHAGFYRNLEAYAKFLNADIHAILGRYKNPTSVFSNAKEDFWVEEVEKYMDANRHNIHKYVTIMGDIKIQPTAVNPMSNMSAISGKDSCIFGAPKVQMETIPVLEGMQPKIMMSTGALTVRNYTDSKSGKIGDFHHVLGFTIVEIKDEETFFIRYVTANEDTGDFTDLCYKVEDGQVKHVDTISAAVLGDLHLGEHDEKVVDTTLNVLLKKLKPKHLVLHDVFNGHSISHHEANDPFKQYEREQDGSNSIKKEVDFMLEWLENVQDYNVTVVRSNHDDFIDRWLKNSDWKRNIKNAKEYIEYSHILLSGKASKGIVPYLINQKFPHINTLDRSVMFNVKGWELGQHGDIGANGSRGSILQFRKLNTKCVVAHYHGPGRKDGALAVGTSTRLRVGYNIGPSSWYQSHVIIHEDSKAQHVNFNNGEFTTFPYFQDRKKTIKKSKKIESKSSKKVETKKSPSKKASNKPIKKVSSKNISLKKPQNKSVVQKQLQKRAYIKSALGKRKKVM